MPAAQVLKNKALRLAGRKRLRVSPMGESSGAKPPPAKATILAQEDGHVVIQVVCSCGQEIQLRCATGAAGA